MPNIETTFDQF